MAAAQDEPGRDTDGPLCRCGHAREAHRHYRKGSDCALCPPGSCSRFRAADGGWRTLFRGR